MPASCVRTSFRAALFIALSALAASAQKTIHIPADQSSIQAGIDAASSGDTVLVAPGTYYENIDFKGKAITVTSSDGAAKTTIDGGAKGPAVTFKTQEPRAAVLSNFTVTHGGFNDAATYNYGGSGIRISNSAPTVLNNIVTQNYCQNIQASASSPLIQGNTISSSLTPEVCFVTNTGGVNVYGVYAGQGITLAPFIVGNTIEKNTTGQSGDGGGDGGAGISISAAGAVIAGNIIRNNLTRTGSGGAIFTLGGVPITIVQNLIYGNSAGCGGGAIASEAFGANVPYTVLIANNTIADNTGGTGGGYSNCAKISQIYADPYTYGTSDASTALVNNIISGSSASYAIDCGSFYNSASEAEANQPVFDHNLLYNVGAPFFGPHCVDTSGRYGNIVADPQFVNSAAGDFHLKSTSPAIDAGNNSVLASVAQLTGSALTKDFEGNARQQDAKAKGYPIVDMGAYEYGGQINASSTTVILTSSAYSGAPGTNYVLTAALASALGTPSGSVAFFEDGQQIGVSAISASGTATLSNFLMLPGAHSLWATYSGQGSFTAAISVIIVLDISQYQTQLKFTSKPNPSLVGEAVTFNITSTSADTAYIPSPITLVDTGNNSTIATLLPDASGLASFTTSTLTLGYHFIEAKYAGDNYHASTVVGLNQVVVNGYPTSITLSSSRNPSVIGQSVTFNVGVTSTNGTPTGSVQFTDNGAPLGTQALDASGHAALSTSALTVGDHNITATYVPTGTFAGGPATLFQTVNAITTSVSVSSSLNPSAYGQAITVTAHVGSNSGSTLSGTVVFSEGTLYVGTQAVNTSGDAAVTLTTTNADLSVGGHLITATFTPTGSSLSVAGNYTQQVNGLPTSTLLTASPTTGVGGVTPITLSATVAPASPGGATPTGSLIFYRNGGQLATVSLVNGIATYTGTLPAGVNQIYAAYAGDPGRVFANSNSNTVTVTMTAAPSTLAFLTAANPEPSFTSLPVSGQLAIPGSSQTLAGYTVTLTLSPLSSGTSSPLNLTAVTNASGIATWVVPGLVEGQYTLAATFPGTSGISPATATPLIETVLPNSTSTTLSASPNPGIQNNPVTLTTSITALAGTAAPIGAITLRDTFAGVTSIIASVLTPTSTTPPVTTLSFTTNSLAPGTHTIYAAYTPVASFSVSQSAPITLIIAPQSFTLTLSEPTLTVPTGHHRPVTVSLTSIGGLTGTFTTTCGSLPVYATCAWSQATVTLPASGTVSTLLTIDTNQLPGFLNGALHPPTNPFAAPSRILFALLAPLTLLGFRRRRKLTALLPILILSALTAMLTACGADKYPASTPPGTYTIPITATSTISGPGYSQTLTATTNLTLVVTL